MSIKIARGGYVDRAYSIVAFSCCVLFPLSTFASDDDDRIKTADPAAILCVAESIISWTEISMHSAKGASQVSQLADQAQLKLAKIQIKQNEEIIKLLRRIADQKR